MVYVHVPYCRSFCTYCGFYSERACPDAAWVDGICEEARRRADEIAASAAINTLYIGGGTPSVLPLDVLGRIADACGGRHYREWTVEVNPDDITPEYAMGLLELGVNRVSMGVQSLDDGMLRWMNRRHDAHGARSALKMLRQAGFYNVSVDVIFGVGGMTLSMLEATVLELLSWRPEHISAYQLSVEEGSALETLIRDGRYTEASEDDCRSQYNLLCSRLSAAGYEHYEISNWARPGYRAVHNSAYWTRAPYVGLGPGGHSLLNNKPQAVQQSLDPKLHSAISVPDLGMRNYRSWNSEELHGWTSAGELLTDKEILEERIMLGLRTADGIPAELLPRGDIISLLVSSAVPGNLRIPEELWFVADDIISSII